MTAFDDCPDVRIASKDDEDSLLALMRVACEEDGQHSFNEDKVRAMLGRHFEKRGGMVGVVGDSDNLRAYILLIIDEVWYSSDWQITELSLFVSPEHRKSSYAKQLMAFSKKMAEGLGLDLTIGVLSNQRTEAKVRLYRRQFREAGAFFLYNGAARG
jgi:GNAT superfamily N-acetyltransferase